MIESGQHLLPQTSEPLTRQPRQPRQRFLGNKPVIITEGVYKPTCVTRVNQSEHSPVSHTPRHTYHICTMFSAMLLALVPFVGAKTLSVDFSEYNSSMTVSEFLSAKGFMINTYDVDGGDPYNRTYEADNVGIADGYLTLKVTGGTKPGSNVPSACIQTIDSNIVSGTFKTTAIASDVEGVCHGCVTSTSV